MQVRAGPRTPPIVILPGFGNRTEDYTCPFGDKDAALTTALERRGFKAFVPPVRQPRRNIVWFQPASLHVSRPWCTSSSKISPACPAAHGAHASLKLRHCVCSTVPMCWCGNAIALQVLRKDWLRIVPGVLSPAFWRAQLTTHPGYSWCASLTQLYATDSSTTSGMRCSCSFV